MARDNILRCLVNATIRGERNWFVIDAYEQGECYALVLEWLTKPGEQTETPAKSVGITKECFEVISDPNAPYELRCRYHVNFDEGDFTDVRRDAEEIWPSGDNLFYPRPKD